MRLVILESPYAGRASARVPRGLRWMVEWWSRRRNIRYARAAVRDCLARGEAPIASHLLYTQPGILRDEVPGERAVGINAGLAWRHAAAVSAFYVDLGWSPGMASAERLAASEHRPIVIRSIPGWSRRAA